MQKKFKAFANMDKCRFYLISKIYDATLSAMTTASLRAKGAKKNKVNKLATLGDKDKNTII